MALLLSRTTTKNICKKFSPLIGGNVVGEQVRRLNLHEYQSKNVMDKYNVRTQRGKEADNAADAFAIAQDIKKSNPDAELILKAQVHAGGRGKGHFLENGLKGGVQILTEPSEVQDLTGQMLGNTFDEWIGQKITLRPAVCKTPQGEAPCVRVKPTIPNRHIRIGVRKQFGEPLTGQEVVK